MKSESGKNKTLRSLERFHHFRCGDCSGWWGIGDAPIKKKDWFCPWCGKKQIFKKILNSK